MKIKIFSLLVLLLFSGCIVFHSGNVSSGPLVSINDKYVETVIGSSRSLTVLLLGDSKYQLIADARKNLFNNRRLNSDEYFSNFSVDVRKELIFGIVYVTRATVSADVMLNRSEPRPDLRTFVQPPKIKKQYFISGTDTFRLGETVYCTRNRSYYNHWKLNHIDSGQVTFLDEASGTLKEFKISRNLFYSTTNTIKCFRAGDTVFIENFDPISIKKSKRVGVILGLNSSEALINTDHGHECQSYGAINKKTE